MYSKPQDGPKAGTSTMNKAETLADEGDPITYTANVANHALVNASV